MSRGVVVGIAASVLALDIFIGHATHAQKHDEVEVKEMLEVGTLVFSEPVLKFSTGEGFRFDTDNEIVWTKPSNFLDCNIVDCSALLVVSEPDSFSLPEYDVHVEAEMFTRGREIILEYKGKWLHINVRKLVDTDDIRQSIYETKEEE